MRFTKQFNDRLIVKDTVVLYMKYLSCSKNIFGYNAFYNHVTNLMMVKIIIIKGIMNLKYALLLVWYTIASFVASDF